MSVGSLPAALRQQKVSRLEKKRQTHEQQLPNNSHSKSNQQHPSQVNQTTPIPRQLNNTCAKTALLLVQVHKIFRMRQTIPRMPNTEWPSSQAAVWWEKEMVGTLVLFDTFCDWHVLPDETPMLPWFSGFQGVLLLGTVSFSQSAILILEIGLSKGVKMGDIFVRILKN